MNEFSKISITRDIAWVSEKNLEKLINNSKASQKKDAELIKQNQKKDVYTNKEDQVQVDFKPKTKRSINKNY